MNSKMRQIKSSGEKQCSFCKKSDINDCMWGEMYELGDLAVHYFCMLFSSGLTQRGEDEDGILGFLHNDLKKEIRRGEKLKCKFCKDKGATIGCVIKQCKWSFHFTCGLPNGTLHQFSKSFASYCPTHKPKSNIPQDLYDSDCFLCCCSVTTDDQAVWPPCCKKYIFHRSCMQKHASVAGLHHFSCPNCREVDKFVKAMQDSGVYVPDRDAQWETDGMFADLEEVYSHCDAKNCKCPYGRNYDGLKEKKDKSWEIMRCNVCAAKAIHSRCSNKICSKWKCSDCSAIITGDFPEVVEVIDSSSDESDAYSDVDHSDKQCLESNLDVVRGPIDFISDGACILREDHIRPFAGTYTYNNNKSGKKSVGYELFPEFLHVDKNKFPCSTAGNNTVVSSCIHNYSKTVAGVDKNWNAWKEKLHSFKEKITELRSSCDQLQEGIPSQFVNSSLSVGITQTQSADVIDRNKEILKNVVKKYLDEKKLHRSGRNCKIADREVTLPRALKTSRTTEISKVHHTEQVTFSSLPSMMASLTNSNKSSELPRNKKSASRSRNSVMTNTLKNNVLEKFKQRLERANVTSNTFSDPTFTQKVVKIAPKFASSSKRNKFENQHFGFQADNTPSRKFINPNATLSETKAAGSRVNSSASASYSEAYKASDIPASKARGEVNDDDSDIECVLENVPSKSRERTEAPQVVEIVDISDEECIDRNSVRNSADLGLGSPVDDVVYLSEDDDHDDVNMSSLSPSSAPSTRYYISNFLSSKVPHDIWYNRRVQRNSNNSVKD